MTKTLSQSDVKVLKEALESGIEALDRVWSLTPGGPKKSKARVMVDRAKTALAILDAQEAAQPEGEWVTVPREPTEAMINAGAGVQYGHFVRETTIPIGCDTAKAAYKAMLLAAAPQPARLKGGL